MQLDSEKLEQFSLQLHVCWDGLYQISGYIGLLIYYIGPTALLGLLTMFLLIPLQGIVMKKLFGYQRRMVKHQVSYC